MRLAAAAIVAALVLAAAPASAALLAAYTVLGPQGAVARAVVDGTQCPPLEADGKTLAMQVRAPADQRFPLICDGMLPAATMVARIDGRPVPAPPRDITRIALFGDSGCRVDARSGAYQACNDDAAWPFARTSAAAAALAPGLVIHVGDYLYRESKCPAGVAGCTGSPSGDDWPAWQADFFAPAAKLLAAAPWIMVRGNHEICSRGGDGFFRLLDPRPLAPTCPFVTPVYQVVAGTEHFWLVDSGEANDVIADSRLVAAYRGDFAAITGPPGAWLLTHRPFWGVMRISAAVGLSVLVNADATLAAAADQGLPPAISLVVSGHIHLFEALGFADRRPPQLIFGTAGSALDKEITTDLVGREIGGTTIAYGRTLRAFGVTTMERGAAGWVATLRDEQGVPRFACTIAGSAVTCTP